MREVTSKAATEEWATGVLKGDTRPATTPRSAAGPTRLRGSLTALCVGAVSLAVLAGPATCPTCNPVHADGPLALSFSTAAIGPALDGLLDGLPAVTAVEATPGVRKLPDTIQQLTDMGPPGVEIAATTIESEPEPPPPSVADTTSPSKNIASVEPAEQELRAGGHSIKRRRAKTFIPTNKYSQAPSWAAKMFETPWQSRAFAFQ